jgi:hypothetical protein
MRVQPNCASLCLLVAVLLCSISTLAAQPASIQENVDIAISPDESNEDRVKAANDVTENWQDSVPVLVQKIDAFQMSGEGGSYSKEAAGKLVPLTDLLVTIVGNKDGSAQKFRETDTGKTVDLLTSAAGGDDRSLRFNASNILIRVVDDNNLCVVLHRLRDPKLGYSGQVNLLQVAILATNQASRENLQAAKQTAEVLKASTERRTAELATLWEQLVSSRLSTAPALPAGSYCATYNVDTGTPTAAPPATPAPAAPSP